MPTESDQNIISSMTSIISSIDNDRHVYRWFLMLISLPKIQQDLSINNKTKTEYQTLKKIQTTEILTYVAMALMMTASCLIKQPLILLTGALPLGVLINLFRKNRKCVASISKQFLINNIQPDELNRQTLYHTCEYFSRKYNIPSLVDIITFQDFIGRKALLGILLLLPFVYSFNVWQIWTASFIVFYAIIAIINTSFVLRRLK